MRNSYIVEKHFVNVKFIFFFFCAKHAFLYFSFCGISIFVFSFLCIISFFCRVFSAVNNKKIPCVENIFSYEDIIFVFTSLVFSSLILVYSMCCVRSVRLCYLGSFLFKVLIKLCNINSALFNA
jgi:hypothetical protein